MMNDLVENKIRELIKECMPKFERVKNLKNNDDLLFLGLDSISFIKLVVLLETNFAIQIPDEKLLLSEFSTIDKILKIVNQLKSET